ncbi:MAG: hypothetical protein WD425_03900 [Nitrospirales bacterium]
MDQSPDFAGRPAGVHLARRVGPAHGSWIGPACRSRVAGEGGPWARGVGGLQELRRKPGGDEAVWKNASMWAGAFGGARVGKPRWLNILPITAGASMDGTGDDLPNTWTII